MKSRQYDASVVRLADRLHDLEQLAVRLIRQQVERAFRALHDLRPGERIDEQVWQR